MTNWALQYRSINSSNWMQVHDDWYPDVWYQLSALQSKEKILEMLCSRYKVERKLLKEPFPNRYHPPKSLYEFRVVFKEYDSNWIEPNEPIEPPLDWSIGLNDGLGIAI